MVLVVWARIALGRQALALGVAAVAELAALAPILVALVACMAVVEAADLSLAVVLAEREPKGS